MLKRISYITGDIITLYVGPKHKRYQIHVDLLRCSAYFEAKIYPHSHTPSAPSNDVSLPDLEPTIFELLITWLYRRTIPAISTDDEDLAQAQARNYIGLYLSAGKWDLPGLQNSIIDLLRARPTCDLGWFPRSLVKKIYVNTNIGSPLRSYVVDTFIAKSYYWDESQRQIMVSEHLGYGNGRFVVECYEAVMGIVARNKIRDPNRKGACLYHVHEKGKKCKR